MNGSFVSFIADWLVVIIVVIAATVLVWRVPNRRKIAIYSRLLMAGLTSYFTAKVMSVIYQPAELRPFQMLGIEPGASYLDNPGFPSDHSLFVWVLVGAIAYAIRVPWLTIAIAVMALAVSVGRVLALVHAPIDVIGGAVAALIGMIWYLPRMTCKKDKSSVQ